MRRSGFGARKSTIGGGAPSPARRLLGVVVYPVQIVVHGGLLAVFAASFAPLFARSLSALATFESFLPHLAAASLILALLALLFRPRWIAILGPIAFAWNIATVWPYLPLDGLFGGWFGTLSHDAVADATPDAAGASAAPVLKVISANVWYRNDGYDAAINYLEASDADVIGLIEVTPLWAEALEPLAAKYPYRIDCITRRPPCEIMLLSKFPFTRSFAGPIDGQSPSIVWGEIAFHDKPVTVAVTHLAWPLRAAVGEDQASAAGTLQSPPLDDSQPLLQSQQGQNLAQYLAGLGPDLVLMGDFNSVPWSHTQRALRAATGLQNAGPMVPTWPSWQPAWIRLPIDQIFTRGVLTRRNFRSGKYIGSDHLPVEAEIAVTGP
jgi:endonuclease/exonuclease/phosphatase (EEP) superfamily protein YafD